MTSDPGTSEARPPRAPIASRLAGPAVLAALAIVFVGPSLVGPRRFVAQHTDEYRPWVLDVSAERLRELEATSNPTGSDNIHYSIPDLLVTFQALREWRLPQWNPYVVAGIPHIAQSLTAVFYPFTWIHAALGLLEGFGPLLALHLFLAGLWMMGFLRAVGLRRVPALLGGVVWAYCGWMTVRAQYYQFQNTATWMPLVLLGVERAARGKRLAAPAIALGVALSVLAGMASVAVLGIYLAGFYATFRAVSLRRGGEARWLRPLGVAAGAGALGLAVAACHLLPMAAAVGESSRPFTAAPPSELAGASLQWPGFVGLVTPALFGHPVSHNSYAAMSATLLDPLDYQFVEWTMYVGLLPLLLAIPGAACAFRRRGAPATRRLARFSLASTILFATFALAPLPLVEVLSRVLPGFTFGDLKRNLLPMSFGLAGLAAVGLQECRDALDGLSRRAIALAASLAVGLVLLAGGFLVAFPASETPRQVVAWREWIRGRHERLLGTTIPDEALDAVVPREAVAEGLDDVRASARRLLALAAAAAAWLAVRLTRRVPPGILGAAAVLLTAVDLLEFGTRLNACQDGRGFLGPTPVVDFLRERAREDPLARLARYSRHVVRRGGTIADSDGRTLLTPNLAAAFGLHDVQGYVLFGDARFHDLFTTGIPDLGAYGSFVDVPFRPAHLDSPLWNLTGTRWFLTEGVIDHPGFVERYVHEGLRRDPLHPERPPPAVRIYENRGALPRAFFVPRARSASSWEDLVAAVTRPGFDPREVVWLEGRWGDGGGEDLVGEGPGPAGEAVRARGEGVRVEAYAPEDVRLRGRSTGPGYLFLSDTFQGGWKVWVDGAPSRPLRADGAFRAVRVPAGSWTVEWRYEPAAVRWGIGISLAGLAGVLLLIRRGVRGGRQVSSPAAILPPAGGRHGASPGGALDKGPGAAPDAGAPS